MSAGNPYGYLAERKIYTPGQYPRGLLPRASTLAILKTRKEHCHNEISTSCTILIRILPVFLHLAVSFILCRCLIAALIMVGTRRTASSLGVA